MAQQRRLTGLPAQALLASLLLLLVPASISWLSRQHAKAITEVQAHSRQQIADMLARTIVLVPPARLELERNDPGAVFVHLTPGYLKIDGVVSDWAALQAETVHYGAMHTLEVQQPYSEESNSFELLAAADQFDLFLLVRVADDRVVYRDINNISVHRNDHVQIAFLNQNQQYQRYTIAAEQPGPVAAFEVSPVAAGSRALRPNEQIEAYWQATAEGYLVEIRIPLAAFDPSAFSLTTNDVDDHDDRKIASTIGTAGSSYPEDLGRLALPAHSAETILAGLLPAGYTATISNQSGKVIASAGAPEARSGLMAQSPVFVDGTPVATITVGTTAAAIAASPDVSLAAGVFLLVAGVLVGFAIYIRLRLNRLGQRIQATVDARGRVAQVLPNRFAPDEIGDLHQAFSRVSERLSQYTRYLESLSRRLAHELRTPVTVVRTSLDNLAPDTADAVYIERARQGVDRLTTILNQMTEASRLEEALNPADTEYFELEALLLALADGYRQAYPDATIALDIDATFDRIDGLPDLIAQMLDKLVNNAVEFAEPGSTIRIRLTREADEAVIRVINGGPELPPEMAGDLFDSMVSVRPHQDGTHLGLGLFIARLVADFHGGTITAANREDTRGVIVTVRLPLLRIVGRR